MAEYFSGRVHTVVWADDTKGFYVLRMVLDGRPSQGDIPVVKGSVPGLPMEVGTWFGFEGEWVQHSQYGRQLSILKAPMVRGWTVDVAAGILAANGVGDRVVGLLRTHFGDDLVPVLDQFDSTLLEAVPGMPPLSAAHIVSRWQAAKAHFQTLEFLAEAGVPRNKVHQVWTLFADNAAEVLSTNPWALVRIDGVTFQQADEVANKLGLDPTSPLRAEGAVRYVVKTRKGLGHLYLTSGEIVAEAQALLGNATQHSVAHAIATLHKAGHLVVDRQTRQGTTAIYEPWLHRMESDAATLVLDRVETARWGLNEETTARYRKMLAATGTQATDEAVDPNADIRTIAAAALRDWSKGSQVSLSGAQLQGALNALVEPVSVLTGLPGTGKTTTLKAVVSILKDADVSFLLVAPTGIAAKRITSVTGATASTIHRAFGAQGWQKGEERESTYVGVTGQSGGIEGSDGSGEQWGCSDAPHSADVIICDETSMVDQHLLYRILSCTKPTARLVFIGDDKQLPSVGPGNVLRDLIASDMFPTVAMTEIFRQADTSQIVVAAHAISRGDVPEVSNSGGEFMLIAANSEDQVLDITIRLAEKLFKQRANFQVMSPRHSGTVGVTNLNSRLRELLNPKSPGLQEMRLGMEVIREDDRIMVVKNNYEKEIFNGDVGKIQKLDRKLREAEIKVHGPPVQYVRLPFKEASDHLRLAYCTTVHKMQGQEADTIVMPLVVSFAHQLQRNLLYTAITRAKKRVILIGHHEAMVRAIANNRPDERNTLFLDRLKIEAVARGGV